ncbi:unnamed protein product [Gadus morhua 'NCC']
MQCSSEQAPYSLCKGTATLPAWEMLNEPTESPLLEDGEDSESVQKHNGRRPQMYTYQLCAGEVLAAKDPPQGSKVFSIIAFSPRKTHTERPED